MKRIMGCKAPMLEGSKLANPSIHPMPSHHQPVPISGLNLGQAVFVMAGGLRGALSLILVADLIITSNFHSSAVVGKSHGLSGMVTVQA